MAASPSLRELKDFARSRLSPGRYDHSLRVAETAKNLAEHFFPGDPDLAASAEKAGTVHDIAREIPPAELTRLAEEWKIPPAPEEKKVPVILHGKVGARILRREFPGLEPEILRAVAGHVLGAAGPGDPPAGPGVLEKIIYIADYIEPGRDYREPEFSRWENFSGMDDFFLRVKEKSDAYHGDAAKPHKRR